MVKETASPAEDQGADPTQRLREAIIAGRFFPNERLVEEDLVRRFGGTRASIRLALAVLEQQGLVVRERNRGARVRLVTEAEAIQIIDLPPMLQILLPRHAAAPPTAPQI